MPPHRPPRRWHLSGAPTSVQLAEIAASLKSGGVLLLPTDTIYGLHVGAAAAAAVGRLSEIKGRDETKPFIVLAADASQVRSLGLRVDAGRLDALADIWPAPLTVVLPLEAAHRLLLADGDGDPPDHTLHGVTRVDVVTAAGADANAVTGAITEALVQQPYLLSAPRDIASAMRASRLSLASMAPVMVASTSPFDTRWPGSIGLPRNESTPPAVAGTSRS